MPFYDYSCADCGGFELLRPVTARDETATCPACHKVSERKVSFQPVLLRSKPGVDIRNPLHVEGCPCCPGSIK